MAKSCPDCQKARPFIVDVLLLTWNSGSFNWKRIHNATLNALTAIDGRKPDIKKLFKEKLGGPGAT